MQSTSRLAIPTSSTDRRTRGASSSASRRSFRASRYDVTIKIEHILRHVDMLGLLRDTGCLMITSAVESIDDEVLVKLRKGHTRADFIDAVGLCKQAGVTLAPTFVPFTPWTTIGGYVDLLEQLDALGLAEGVAPIQLAIRLLVTAESKLLELPDIRDLLDPFDAAVADVPVASSRSARGRSAARRHADRWRSSQASRGDTFDRILTLATGTEDRPARAKGAMPPYMTEGWYCCAEPGPEQMDLV